MERKAVIKSAVSAPPARARPVTPPRRQRGAGVRRGPAAVADAASAAA
jgi:hypothetical protein